MPGILWKGEDMTAHQTDIFAKSFSGGSIPRVDTDVTFSGSGDDLEIWGRTWIEHERQDYYFEKLRSIPLSVIMDRAIFIKGGDYAAGSDLFAALLCELNDVPAYDDMKVNRDDLVSMIDWLSLSPQEQHA